MPHFLRLLDKATFELFSVYTTERLGIPRQSVGSLLKTIIKAFYSDHFVLPLPEGHRFPMAKYRLLRERVELGIPAAALTEPPAATDGQLALAHTPDYIARLCNGTLTAQQQRALGFPWSIQMVERSRRSTGATIAACQAAIIDGAAVNLAGGTHHAFADRGEGFCCFNDVAVAARLMQAQRLASNVLIIDLDVHQGNGTAAILGNDDSIFTLSMHGEQNYPFRKELSDLDVGLADGLGDADYLIKLGAALHTVEMRFKADLIIYLSGADVYAGDRLGRLKLTEQGIAARDAMVMSWAGQRNLPVAACMGGGYCPRIEETVAIHFNTVLALNAYCEAFEPRPAIKLLP